MNKHEETLKRYGLPALETPPVELRYVSSRDDWYARTEAGWFYCQTQNVEPENRKWLPLPYGPMI